MSAHLLNVHRWRSPFRAPAVERVLGVLERRLPGFFPAALPVGPGREATIGSSGDFDRRLVPAEYWIVPGRSVRVPLYGRDGATLEVVDDRAPDVAPAHVGLRWPSDPPPAGVLAPLLVELCAELEAHRGRVTDEATLVRPDLLDRAFHIDTAAVPEALHWMTWFGPAAVSTLGPDRFADLARVARVEPAGGGQLVVLQDETFLDDRPDHVARRAQAEAAFGLADLHTRHRRA